MSAFLKSVFKSPVFKEVVRVLVYGVLGALGGGQV